MLSILYSIFIYPLEYFYQQLYHFFYITFGSLGWGLLFLSIISTIIYTPLKGLAAKIQDRERRIQSILGPQMLAIKSQSQGAERHNRIKGLYKRYGYHPIYGIRSVFAVLVQVPFLIAAYNMLVSCQPIEGRPFGPIADLSRPDGLLFGLNLLPFIMTMFNIGALYTTRSFTSKERVQGLVIAALFLVLLYAAPAALLVYWTANNALFFFQNIYARLRPARAPRKALKLKEAIAEFKRKNAAPAETSPGLASQPTALIFAAMLGVGFLLLVPGLMKSLRVQWLDLMVETRGGLDWTAFLPDAVTLAFALLIFLPLAIWNLKKSPRPKAVRQVAALVFLWLSLCAVFAVTFLHRESWPDLLDNFAFAWFYAVIALAVAVSFASPTRPEAEAKLNLDLDIFNGLNGPVYFSSILAFGLLAFFFNPSALYNSSPDMFFPYAYADILKHQLPVLASWLALAGLVWLIAPNLQKTVPAVCAAIICLWALLGATILSTDYGPMRGTTFIDRGARFGPDWLALVKDFTVAALVGTILLLQYKLKKTRVLVMTMYLAGVTFISFGLYCWFEEAGPSAGPAADRGQARSLYSFSADQENVVVFIMDSFDNRHLKLIFDRHPEIRGRFSGFVLYDDVVAEGSSTVISMPSVYGGYGFTPQAINQRPGVSRQQETINALAWLPRFFTNKGYRAAMVGQSFSVYYQQVQERLEHPELFEGYEFLPGPDLAVWREHIGLGAEPKDNERINYSGFFTVMSIFRMAPFSWKKVIYDDGKWLHYSYLVHDTDKRETVGDSAVLGLWPLLGRLDSPGPTAKICMTNLTHAMWFLGPDSLIPVSQGGVRRAEADRDLSFEDDDEYDQYCSERHALRLLADFIDWLKNSDIYDNTRIVLVSDHNDINWGYSRPDFREALQKQAGGSLGVGSRIGGDVRYIIRPAAILMVKDFEAQGDLTHSGALMSTADVPSLACAGLSGCPALADTGPGRVRSHAAGPWRPPEHPASVYKVNEYTIRGEMDDVKNWSW